MFFEMNLSRHPPVRRKSEHKTDTEVKKLPLESILRRIQHPTSPKRLQICLPAWNKLAFLLDKMLSIALTQRV